MVAMLASASRNVSFFEQAKHPIERVLAAEAAEIEFRAKVVMIEEKTGPEQKPVKQRDKEHQIRRIARLDDIDPLAAAHSKRQPQLMHQRGNIFGGVSLGGSRLDEVMAIDVHAISKLIAIVEALALGTDYRNDMARALQGERLLPDAPIKGHGQVLNQYEHVTWLADLNLLYPTRSVGPLRPKPMFRPLPLKRKGREVGHRPDGVFIDDARLERLIGQRSVREGPCSRVWWSAVDPTRRWPARA
ncbi:hypothetical protein [Devosia riboflavina]